MDVDFESVNRLVDEDYIKSMNAQEKTKRDETRVINENWWKETHQNMFRNFLVYKMEIANDHFEECGCLESPNTVRVFELTSNYVSNFLLLIFYC
jgi:hypothetical protein